MVCRRNLPDHSYTAPTHIHTQGEIYMTAKLKLVSSTEKTTSKRASCKKRNNPWNSIHGRLPVQGKSILVKYRFGLSEFNGKLNWWTACAAGRYSSGKFHFYDPLLDSRVDNEPGHGGGLFGRPSFLTITDWRYFNIDSYEGQRSD